MSETILASIINGTGALSKDYIKNELHDLNC